jgi:hypothetical protein
MQMNYSVSNHIQIEVTSESEDITLLALEKVILHYMILQRNEDASVHADQIA